MTIFCFYIYWIYRQFMGRVGGSEIMYQHNVDTIQRQCHGEESSRDWFIFFFKTWWNIIVTKNKYFVLFISFRVLLQWDCFCPAVYIYSYIFYYVVATVFFAYRLLNTTIYSNKTTPRSLVLCAVPKLLFMLSTRSIYLVDKGIFIYVFAVQQCMALCALMENLNIFLCYH